MLMSLTMRLRPTPPADSWGVISVVAIQHLPSLAGGIVLPVIYGLQRRKHPIIRANEPPRPVKSPACGPDEPILKRGEVLTDSLLSLVELGHVAELIISGHEQFSGRDFL